MTVRVLTGDCRAVLATMPDEFVHMVCTSPPYWGLRCYGVDGQLGQEKTPEEHVAVMVDVFRHVRRVLRKDGTLWLNYGDCYHSGNRGGYDRSRVGVSKNLGGHANDFTGAPNRLPQKGLKDKDLVMMPARIALAFQADGWWLRSEIIWAKPNPMPESITDRPTSSHEKMFLFARSARYFYDAKAVRTPAVSETAKMPDGWDTGPGAHGTVHRLGREKGHKTDKQRGHGRRHDGFNDRWDQMPKSEQQAMGANLRNVWHIATHPYPEAHFATFPPALVEPCIKAGCPEGGTVLDPFGGSGTVGLVADRLGRDAILIELNPEYADMARARITQDAPLFAEVGT